MGFGDLSSNYYMLNACVTDVGKDVMEHIRHMSILFRAQVSLQNAPNSPSQFTKRVEYCFSDVNIILELQTSSEAYVHKNINLNLDIIRVYI